MNRVTATFLLLAAADARGATVCEDVRLDSVSCPGALPLICSSNSGLYRYLIR
jgi:hypothetical protein